MTLSDLEKRDASGPSFPTITIYVRSLSFIGRIQIRRSTYGEGRVLRDQFFLRHCILHKSVARFVSDS